jgi:nitrogen-specific signal transduction histidine kinase
MPVEQRERFLKNIRNEANRIQQIVDRLLDGGPGKQARKPH